MTGRSYAEGPVPSTAQVVLSSKEENTYNSEGDSRIQIILNNIDGKSRDNRL